MQVSTRKTYRVRNPKRFMSTVNEIYQQPEVYCGWSGCTLCQDTGISYLAIDSNDELTNKVFIFDTSVLKDQLDLIQNCPLIRNAIIFQSSAEYLKQNNKKSFQKLKNLVDIQSDKNFYLFPNEFSQDCFIEKENTTSIQDHIDQLVLKAFNWYKVHWSSAGQDVDLIFITNNFSQYSEAKKSNVSTFTIQEFVKDFCADYPNVVDYLGINFDYDSEFVELKIENKEFLLDYATHLPIEELKQEINVGNLIKGKLRINRTNPQEAVISTQYGFDVKILGYENLNRAVNGDFVGVELLKEESWLQ
jgi:exosome complex exonuclease DIS3/RRP44